LGRPGVFGEIRPVRFRRIQATWSGCAQGVLSLGKQYAPERFEAAGQRALAHDSPYFRTVKTILATGAVQHGEPAPVTPTGYANSRFACDASSLFAPPAARTAASYRKSALAVASAVTPNCRVSSSMPPSTRETP